MPRPSPLPLWRKSAPEGYHVVTCRSVTLGSVVARSTAMVAERAWQLGQAVRPAAAGRDGGLIPPPGDWLGNPYGPYVWGPESARRIPSVGRCLGLYGGLMKQMKLNAYRGGNALTPRPPLLDAPDPHPRRAVVRTSVRSRITCFRAMRSPT